MKKLLSILLASTLVLGACGNKEESKAENKTESVNENKAQFKNDTLVLDQAVLYLKDAFIVKNTENDKKEIAIKYEVKNKTDKSEITPLNVWTAGVNVKQDDDNTVSDLDTGVTIADGGKYKEWLDNYDDSIKKGKKAKGLATYQLKNDKKVILEFNQGINGKELGKKEYDLSKLKTIDYDFAKDVTSNSTSNNETSNASASNNEIEDTGSSEESEDTNNNVVASNNTSKDAAQVNDVSTQSNATADSNNVQQESNQKQQAPIQSNNENVESVSNKQSQPSEVAETKQNQTNNESNRIPYDKDHPTLHDESQMEQVPQQHSGGHPSAFGKSDVPVGVEKQDSNGESYYDATGE